MSSLLPRKPEEIWMKGTNELILTNDPNKGEIKKAYKIFEALSKNSNYDAFLSISYEKVKIGNATPRI